MLFRTFNMLACIIFAGLSFISSSCREESYKPPLKEGKVVTFFSFPESYSLKGENAGPIGLFGRLRDMIFDAGWFILSDMANDTVFHLLDSNLRHVQGFGIEGEGPEELKFDPLLSKHHFAQMGRFFCYEFARRTLTSWPFEQGSVHPDIMTRFPLPDTVQYVQQVIVVDTGLCVALGEMEEGKLCFFNPFAHPVELVAFTPYLPAIVGQEGDVEMSRYRGKLASSSSGNKIICVNSYFPQIEIYDRRGNLTVEVRSVETGEFLLPDNKKEFFFYYDVDVTEQYIYALYLGLNKKSPADVLLGKDSQIHIWDHQGMPVALVKLDRLVNAFCVDEETKRIVAIDEDNEKQPLVVYQLPESLYLPSRTLRPGK